jgi:hypothetical protein
MYTDAHVRRLKLLRRAVERGQPIGRAAKLNDVELEELCASLGPIEQPAHEPETPPAANGFERAAMLDAVSRFDQTALGTALGRAAALMRPSQFVSDVALPLLADVTERCRAEGKSSAERHLASSTVRNILGLLLHRHAGGPGARLLFASLAENPGELGALAAAVLASSGGLDAVYLGAGVSAADIVDAATCAEADVVVVGTSERLTPELASRQVTAIVRGLSVDVEVWVEGAGAGSIAGRIGTRVEAVETPGDLLSNLTRVGARLT